MNLTENMRVKNACLQGSTEEKDYAEYLLRVGNGEEPTVPIPGEDQMIKIPEDMKSKSTSLYAFTQEIFPGLVSRHQKAMEDCLIDNEWDKWLMERAIICPTNDLCEDINKHLIDSLPGKPMVYHSTDKIINQTEAFDYPQEFLWKISTGSMPPHTLVLKKGAPIMLLRNLDKENGIVNGARFVVQAMTSNIIYARLATEGPHKGKTILIPRILFHPKDRTLPFEMERKQFPVRLCFAMTANKVQGQTLNKVGVNLTKDFFSHGQLYVALSRAGSRKNVSIFKPKEDPYPNLMRNVVFREIL